MALVTADVQTIKCVLVGNACSGKTAFVSALTGRKIPEKYTPSLGVEITPITFKTATGKDILFIVYDCASRAPTEGFFDEYYARASCAIIMYDASIAGAQNEFSEWRAKLTAKNGTIRFVTVGTHLDKIRERMSPAVRDTLVSSTDGTNCRQPFEIIVRALANTELESSVPSTATVLAEMPPIDCYALTPLITSAIVDLHNALGELLRRSELRGDYRVSSDHLSGFAIISEFLRNRGITTTDHKISCGNEAIEYVFDSIQKSKHPVTKEFIDGLDRIILEFIIARIQRVRSVFKETRIMYRAMIADIEATAPK